MRRTVMAASTLMALAGLAGACSTEPAAGVSAPGAPSGRDSQPTITTIAPSVTAAPPRTVATTTTIAPASTTSIAQGSAAPSTTVGADTNGEAAVTSTTVAPTTTELVYVAEPADGALTVGVEGPRSLAVQQSLITLGILPESAADGKFGPGTAGGVRRFQQSEGLVVDGVAGPRTLTALDIAVSESGPQADDDPPADEAPADDPPADE